MIGDLVDMHETGGEKCTPLGSTALQVCARFSIAWVIAPDSNKNEFELSTDCLDMANVILDSLTPDNPPAASTNSAYV